MLTIRHYKIFEAVANCLSMSQAAKKLYISQPTISQTIIEMEKHYNVSLFIRYPKRIALTEEGKVLLNESETLLNAYDQTVSLNLQSMNLTWIRLGVTYTVSSTLLNDIIEKTNELDKTIDFHVNESNSSSIEHMILKNDIDFGIIEGDIRNKDIIKVPIAYDCLVLVCGKNHPFYGLNKINIKQLNGENFVVLAEGSSTRKIFENEMLENNIKYNITWECTSMEAMKMAAINNRGMAVISARLIKDELANGDLHIVKANELIWKKDIYLCYHKNFKKISAFQTFYDTAIAYKTDGVQCPVMEEMMSKNDIDDEYE